MTPYDYQNEPGVQDATYQDFVAPLLLGLGLGPKLLSGGASTVARSMTAVAPAIEKATEESSPNATTAEDILTKFLDKAQEIGDFARVFKYKALRSAMEQTQMPANEVFEKILKIHADTNPIATGLSKG